MGTHLPGFQSFFRFFVFAKLATSSIRVNRYDAEATFVHSTRMQRLLQNIQWRVVDSVLHD